MRKLSMMVAVAFLFASSPALAQTESGGGAGSPGGSMSDTSAGSKKQAKQAKKAKKAKKKEKKAADPKSGSSAG